jgi:low temperature requirement protein LtrA
MCAGAFGADALLFACAYRVVRAAHILLFVLASRDDPGLRHSVRGLAASIALGLAFLLAAACFGGAKQIALWGLAVALDMGVAAALLGVVVAATLWWLYFDVVAIAAERIRHSQPRPQSAD